MTAHFQSNFIPMKTKFLPWRRIPVNAALIPCIALLLSLVAALAQPALSGTGADSPPIIRCHGPTLIPIESPPPQPDFTAASGSFTIVPVFDATTSAVFH